MSVHIAFIFHAIAICSVSITLFITFIQDLVVVAMVVVIVVAIVVVACRIIKSALGPATNTTSSSASAISNGTTNSTTAAATTAAASSDLTPGPSIDSVLDALKGPKTISTVAKSSVDWNNFKEEEGLEDSLMHAGKDG